MLIFDALMLLLSILKGRKCLKSDRPAKGGLITVLVFTTLFAFVNVWVLTGHFTVDARSANALSESAVKGIAGAGLAVDATAAAIAVSSLVRSKRKAKDAGQDAIAARLYSICTDNGITGAETEEQRRGIRLVAVGNLHIAEKDAVAMFERGREIVRATQAAEDKKTRDAQEEQKKQNEAFMEQKWIELGKRHALVGKAKYVQPFYDKLEQYRRDLAGANKNVSDMERAANQMYWETNSSVAGGIAQGIAGVGAGLVTYMESEQHNASVRAAKAQFLSDDPAKIRYRRQQEARKYAENYGRFAPWFDRWIVDAVIDDGVDASVFSDVKLTVVKQENYKDTPWLIADIASETAGEYSVLGSPASLDGTVHIDVYDGEKKVGEGFYSPHSYGATDLSKTGFKVSKPRSVQIRPVNGAVLRADAKYEYRFTPEKLWLIQAKKVEADVLKGFGDPWIWD